jgi:hypothetical protein
MKKLTNNGMKIANGLLLFVALSAYGESKQATANLSPTTIISASLGFLIADSAGQSVYFGYEDESFYCELSWQLVDLDPNAKIAISKTSKRKSDKTTSISCNYQSGYFVQSSKHNTEYSASIIENNPAKKTAILLVNLDLININKEGPRNLTIKPTRLQITPELYAQIIE